MSGGWSDDLLVEGTRAPDRHTKAGDHGTGPTPNGECGDGGGKGGPAPDRLTVLIHAMLVPCSLSSSTWPGRYEPVKVLMQSGGGGYE